MASLTVAAYEANNNSHVAYLPDKNLLSSCILERSLKIFPPALSSADPDEIETNYEEGIADFVVTKTSDGVVVASADHEVALFHFANKSKSDILLRTDHNINCMSCSTSNHLAVATDGNEISIVHLESKKQSIVSGHVGAVRAVAYDPLDKYLASIDSTGGLRITRTESQAAAFSSKAQFPKVEGKDISTLRLSWHPQGTFLAVPGRPEVQLLARDAWTNVIELKGVHTKPVAVVEFSPNGRYLASAGADLKLVVWDVASKSLVSSDFITLPAPCHSMSWHPSANALAYCCANGQISVWNKPVPGALPDGFSTIAVSTTATAASTMKRKAEGSVEEEPVVEDTPTEAYEERADENHDQDQEEEETKTEDGVLGDLYGTQESSDEDQEEHPNGVSDEDDDSRKERRRLKRAKLGNSSSSSSSSSSHKSSSSSSSSSSSTSSGGSRSAASERLQPPFVSGSTPEAHGSKSKYYLLWNALGTVTSQDQDTYSVITTEYSEKSKKSNKSFKDHNGYKMCALGEHGAIFVSQHSVDTPSQIYFQQMDGWGSQGDWHLTLPRHEDPVGCAIGDMWAVVATSQHLLRVFSYGGIQRGLLSLDGPLVTMAAQSSLLAVVWHRGASVGGTPSMGVRVIDMNKREVKHEGSLPISPHSTLTWLSFVESGMLMSADSSGLVRGLSHYWGNMWCVVLDLTQAKQEKESSRGVYWPVTVMEDKLMVMDCRDPKHPYPRPTHKALLLPVPLQMPFIDVHKERSGAGAESKIAVATLLRHEAGASKKDLIEIDKLILQHINTSITNDQLVKAQDLCTSLGVAQSLDLAVKIAEKKNKSHLVERMQILIQARQGSQIHKPATVIDEKDTLLRWDEGEAPKPEKKRLLQAKIAPTSSKEVKEPPKGTREVVAKSPAKPVNKPDVKVSPPAVLKAEVVKSEAPTLAKPPNPFAKKNPFGI